MSKEERIKAREGIAETLREAGYVLSHATGLAEDLESPVAARQVLEISVSDITARMKKALDMFLVPADDPVLSEPSSPALERYRNARAALVELEVENKRKFIDDPATFM